MKIFMAGGGTLGHVMPLLAVAEELRKKSADVELVFVGERGGREQDYLMGCGERFIGIPCGKVRRYFDLQNFLDPFKIVVGIFTSLFWIAKERPDVVFAKGGYVSLPVAVAAFVWRVPVVVHESDAHMGLANQINGRFAQKICVSFDCISQLPGWASGKAVVTGNPIRSSLLQADAEVGRKQAVELLALNALADDLRKDKPLLLVLGGSLGAASLNKVVVERLDDLLVKYNVILQCGKGKLSGVSKQGFVETEFLSDVGNLMRAADLVVSRGGAGNLFELLALKVPSVIVPLPTSAGNHQYKNAKLLADAGAVKMLEEKSFVDNGEVFVDFVNTSIDFSPQESNFEVKLDGAEGIATLLLKS